MRGAFFINGDISIHALVKRATLPAECSCTSFQISIHALVKRATDIWQKNSAGVAISIHALVKRATKKS